ncbi:MAG: hypothetical protein IPM06_15425 [Rhizobiales bacterium]|nr:hypothetical protein [Hyphomicrobiales bacterium]
MRKSRIQASGCSASSNGPFAILPFLMATWGMRGRVTSAWRRKPAMPVPSPPAWGPYMLTMRHTFMDCRA